MMTVVPEHGGLFGNSVGVAVSNTMDYSTQASCHHRLLELSKLVSTKSVMPCVLPISSVTLLCLYTLEGQAEVRLRRCLAPQLGREEGRGGPFSAGLQVAPKIQECL